MNIKLTYFYLIAQSYRHFLIIQFCSNNATNHHLTSHSRLYAVLPHNIQSVMCSHITVTSLTYVGLQLAAGNSFVFGGLPQPNRACLVGVYAVTLDPLLSLYGIIIHVTWYIYQTPTKIYQRHIPVAFGIPDHVTYQTPTRHALLGSGRC